MHFHFSGIEYIKDIFGMIYFQSLINWMNKHMTKSRLCCSVQSISKSDYWKSFIIQKKKTGYLFVKTLHPTNDDWNGPVLRRYRRTTKRKVETTIGHKVSPNHLGAAIGHQGFAIPTGNSKKRRRSIPVFFPVECK